MSWGPSDRTKAQAALHTPAKLRARRIEAEKRLRGARAKYGKLTIRCQPYIKVDGTFKCLVGEALYVTVDEAVDVWELLADTVRFWRCWRSQRRRTPQGLESVKRAWELLERAQDDLRP